MACLVLCGTLGPRTWGADGSTAGRAVAPAGSPPALSPTAHDARALAGRIDRFLSARWSEARIQPAHPADDAEYLRRVYLDLVGKIPTAMEAVDFLDDPTPEKRALLVEQLLDSSAYLTRATEIYRTMLLPEAETDAQVRQLAPTFEAWLRKRVSDNVGYDKLVREVLTARLGARGRPGGNALDPRAEPSPLAFYVAKDAKPENLAAGAARVFLGLRLECAQCHNHPFAHWKREEFWGLAAFFAGVSKQGGENVLGAIRENNQINAVAIPGTTRIIEATFLDAKGPGPRARTSSRVLLADWVTKSDNPYFARAAVNRVWARFFGIGLVDPVDDMGEENPPAHPELLDELARQFVAHGYDLKFLIRALTATRAYGLTSAVGRSELAPPQYFAAMPVRTLSPGQLFDTIAQATRYRDGLGRNMDMGESARGRFLELFANRDEKPTEGQTSILQALMMMNGPIVTNATSLENGDTLAAVAEAPFLDTPARIEALYLAALTRRPRLDEQAILTPYVDRGGPTGDRSKALADVFWALLNSPEFRFNH
jgi:hypothetical protein